MNPAVTDRPASAKVHPTAVLDPTVKVGEGVEIAPYAVIGPETDIGAGTIIGPHAVVEYASLGENCRIHAHAFVGTEPQDLKYKGEKTRVKIGDRVTIRECVTVNRGTSALGVTTVGNDCLLMAYVHVAHDCVLGNNVVMANGATLAGHVDVADNVFFGGMTAVHQFTRIGAGAMIGGGSKVASDVPPFCMTHGDRAVLVGLNVVGLRRKGLPRETLAFIKRAYKTVFLSGLGLREAVASLEKETLPAEVKIFVDFLKAPARGLTRPRAKGASSHEENAEA